MDDHGKTRPGLSRDLALMFSGDRARRSLSTNLITFRHCCALVRVCERTAPVLSRKDETEISEIDAAPLSKEFKKRWSYFIRKVYETDPLAYPKCQGEMRIISFIDQPEVIKKILQHLGLWEESHAPPEKLPPIKEITFDPSYSLSQRLIRLRWKLI
jgi:hypothetical protein